MNYEPDPAHDLRHRLPTDFYGRESLVYHAHLAPEWVLSVYLWVTAKGVAGYAAALFGPAAGPKAVFEALDGIQMPDDADFTDWRVGDLHLQHLEPLRTARVALRGKRLNLEMEFRAMHPAFAYERAYDNPRDGLPPFLGTNRLEQSGYVSGYVRVDGKEYPITGLGHRDHSSGRRAWEMMQQYKWIEAQTPSFAINALTIDAQGRRWHLGYVYRDGEVSAIRHTEWAVEYDDRWVQDDMTITATDALGRKTTLTATRFGRHEYPVGTATKLVDTAVEVEIEGEQGSGYTDFGWPIDYLRHMREFAGAGSPLAPERRS